MTIRRITASLASLFLAFFSPLLLAQQAPVIAKKVTRMSMPMQAESLGTTMANESVNITSKVSERVSRILFEEGQLVKAGQVLVELDTDEARANLAVASADFSESRSNFKRAEELDRTKSISQSELKQLQLENARLRKAHQELRDQLERIKNNPSEDERIAREKNTLARPGDIIVNIPE